ncbi:MULTISPECIES: LysR family transcriptional regulator [Pseudomonas]|uniref:Substrate-binding transcriptional regulator, LysR family n=1 Tax=Ectopseudomonas oleovorans TaxID=301 RepID=A0A653B9W9_ECTOL|nr:LysR family transcriptional regulator [Pseudomonas sp. BMW13]CAE6912890.1 HTH-type transcriptional repressor PA14_22550 [Pseudomonas oleovorans]
MDKLSAMRTFSCVVEHGSFSRAADVLGIPKARVSQRVADLEKVLGVRLLHRTTRAVSLTADGLVYAEQCRQVLDSIEELEARLAGGTSSPRGRLRVETQTAFSRWILSPKLIEFRDRYPQIQVLLGAHHQVRNLLEDGIDCAIRGGPVDDSSLSALHVMDVHAGLYASPGYLQDFGPTAEPEMLERADLVGWFDPRTNTPRPWFLRSGASAYDLKRPPRLLLDDPESAVAAATMGAGITPASPFAVEHLVRQGRLVPVLPQWHLRPQPVHIVYPANRFLSARVRAFVDWAFQMMSNDAKLHLRPHDLVVISHAGAAASTP